MNELLPYLRAKKDEHLIILKAIEDLKKLQNQNISKEKEEVKEVKEVKEK